MDIADAEVGTNGDLISWDVANPIEISMAVIPVTDDYEFLVTLAKSKPSRKKQEVSKRRDHIGSRYAKRWNSHFV